MRALEKLESQSYPDKEKIITGGLSFPEIKKFKNNITKYNKIFSVVFSFFLLFIGVWLFKLYNNPSVIEENKNYENISQTGLLNADKKKEEKTENINAILNDKKLASLMPDRKTSFPEIIQVEKTSFNSNKKKLLFQDSQSIDFIPNKFKNQITEQSVINKNKSEKRESFKNKINFFSASKIPFKTYNETDMNLQAIVWADNPDQKMVVVNDRILHEGASEKGVVISLIGEDYVIFFKNGEKWKQTIKR